MGIHTSLAFSASLPQTSPIKYPNDDTKKRATQPRGRSVITLDVYRYGKTAVNRGGPVGRGAQATTLVFKGSGLYGYCVIAYLSGPAV